MNIHRRLRELVTPVVGIAALHAPLSHAQAAVADGTYQKILVKWGLQQHAVPKALVNAGS